MIIVPMAYPNYQGFRQQIDRVALQLHECALAAVKQ
jgi:hypothetical protein